MPVTVNILSAEFWMGLASLFGILMGAVSYFVRVGKSDERQLQLAEEVKRAHSRIEDLEDKLQRNLGEKIDRLSNRLADVAREVSELKGYRMGAPRRSTDEDDDGR